MSASRETAILNAARCAVGMGGFAVSHDARRRRFADLNALMVQDEADHLACLEEG